ncbi:NAD(P)/FAD-dependent oxidoreductase [Streptomyces uncialis]|uniref:NAD(P)/FAD-dependent oxidoreductase n=1 Tax=Streptomyces uncialis TaxID=1048205 RepID=UPI0009A12D78|nr:FAD-dependent oxidoreductase [Streptomyces uncialis]
MTTYDYLLVGGGIVGACLAEELAGTGASVAVLDAGTEAGRATRQAAGVAVPSLRYLGRPELYRWLCEGRARLDEDIRRLEPEHGPFSVARPILRALRASDAEAHAGRLDLLADAKWVGAEDLPGVAPGMKLPAERRYLLDPGGLMVDGARYLAAVRARCDAAGVSWHQDTEVRALTEHTGYAVAATSRGSFRADRVVVTAGAWSGGPLAPSLPVFPQRGQLVVLKPAAEVPLIFSSAFYLAPGVDGGVIVGATEEDAGFDESMTAAGVARLLMFAVSAVPGLSGATPCELRAGLRPATRGGEPLLGRIPDRSRTYVAAGHAGHGLLSARLSARGMSAGLVRDAWEEIPESMCPAVALAAGNDQEGHR